MPTFAKGIKYTGSLIKKTVIFNNDSSDITLFNITGTVKFRLCAVCKTSLVSAGGCLISLKVGAKELIPQADLSNLTSGIIWRDNIKFSLIERFYDSDFEYTVGDNTNIVLSVESGKQIDSGTMDFYIEEWQKLSNDGNIVVV